jgi:hypothetical protein
VELLLASCASDGGIGIVVLCGLHATWTIGVTGGPNHGEHPLLVNLFHLIATIWVLNDWPPQARWTYRGLLAAGVVLGMLVMELRQVEHPKRCWTARAAMVSLYAGLLTLIIRH